MTNESGNKLSAKFLTLLAGFALLNISCSEQKFEAVEQASTNQSAEIDRPLEPLPELDNDGSEVDEESPGLPEVAPPPALPTVRQGTKTFNTSAGRKQADILWVIDNSNSMVEEANSVRTNIARFMQRLNGQLDTKVGFISRMQPYKFDGFGRQLPDAHVTVPDATGVEVVRLDYFVHSFNPLLLAAVSTCPATPASTDSFCWEAKSITTLSRAYGSFRSFFRTNSNKLIVFVTDDDSRTAQGQTIQIDDLPISVRPKIQSVNLVENLDFVTERTFLDRMTREFGAAALPQVAGFISFNRAQSPCLFRESTVYNSLIAKTSALAFNICDADWSHHFDSLSNSIIEKAQTEFFLGYEAVKKVNAVTVNGKKLLASQFSVKANSVKIVPSEMTAAGSYEVKIDFEY